MAKRFIGLLVGLTLAAPAAFAQAQQPAAPAPVPEQMPFDIPYGTSITLEQAVKIAGAAESEAKKHNWKTAAQSLLAQLRAS